MLFLHKKKGRFGDDQPRAEATGTLQIFRLWGGYD